MRVNGEFYVAPTYNLCIAQGKRIGVARIRDDGGGMHGLGTPPDLWAFRSTDAYRANANDPHAELREMTKAYVWAFNSRNTEALAGLFTDQFTLKDPNGLFEGKSVALQYIKDIFADYCSNLQFKAQNILIDQDAAASAIEFDLRLADKSWVGVDVISWQQGRIQGINAYLSLLSAQV